MKNLIASVLFVLVSIFGFSQNYLDSTQVYSDLPLSVRVVPFKVTKNGNQKEVKKHYIFQVSHNFIYCIDKNHNIKYTMEITNMINFNDRIEVYAKRFDSNKNEVFFSVPLNEDVEFKVLDKKGLNTYTNVIVQITTEYDLYNKKGL